MSEEKKEDWMNSKWRPAMGWMYMCVCAFDFVVFPILWAVVQFWEVEAANDAFRQWKPLTLEGAGLFHIAMGAVLGVSAWSRGQEKMASLNNPTPVQPVSLPLSNNQFSPSLQQFNVPQQNFVSSQPVNYDIPTPTNVEMSGQTSFDSKGRLRPVEPRQPEI